MELQKEYKTMMGFGSALARLLIKDGAEGQALDETVSANIKHQIGSSYNSWADGALTLWNWGMHDEQTHSRIAAQIPEFDQHDSDGFCEQLYCYTFGHAGVSERPRKILEVGSGAGAGLNFLSRLNQKDTFIGVDLAQRAVARATARFSRPGAVSFVNGDAENLPFKDGEFDVVINVESSHNYPHVGAFLAEVGRVLKPGGTFSFVDFFTDERLAEFEKGLTPAASALQPQAQHDISENVRTAIRRRMDPDSIFRAQVRKSSPLGTRYIQEQNALLQYGSPFASKSSLWNKLSGTSDGLRVVSKLNSYRHFSATKVG